MTRINLVPVQSLPYQHLWAEHREAPRIFNHVKKHGIDKSHIPKDFCLGKGHVLFFTDKLDFVDIRIFVIIIELINRGIKPIYSYDEFIQRYKPQDLCDNKQMHWKPSRKDINLSASRIYERIAKNPKHYSYYPKR